jgi:hypothetical protein
VRLSVAVSPSVSVAVAVMFTAVGRPPRITVIESVMPTVSGTDPAPPPRSSAAMTSTPYHELLPCVSGAPAVPYSYRPLPGLISPSTAANNWEPSVACVLLPAKRLLAAPYRPAGKYTDAKK